MSITRAVGGQRLGSGNKMDVQMHGYERSTHNLSRVFRSSSTVGTLVPFMTEIGLNGDKIRPENRQYRNQKKWFIGIKRKKFRF